MEPYLKSLNSMLAVWNTTNADEKRRLVEAALEHNVHFADPNHNIIGREPFLKMVDEVQARIPGAVYSRSSDIGFQNNFCRYHWEIRLKGQLIVSGFDVTEVNDTGKIVKIIGFFGELKK